MASPQVKRPIFSWHTGIFVNHAWAAPVKLNLRRHFSDSKCALLFLLCIATVSTVNYNSGLAFVRGEGVVFPSPPSLLRPPDFSWVHFFSRAFPPSLMAFPERADGGLSLPFPIHSQENISFSPPPPLFLLIFFLQRRRWLFPTGARTDRNSWGEKERGRTYKGPIRRSSVSQGCCGRVWKGDTKNPY